ncbi:MAG: B12-binding domain-containing radical SAM protein, partial [Endomicrobiales bacterium]
AAGLIVILAPEEAGVCRAVLSLLQGALQRFGRVRCIACRSEDDLALRVNDRDTAFEITLAKPLYGMKAYRKFIYRNSWKKEFDVPESVSLGGKLEALKGRMPSVQRSLERLAAAAVSLADAGIGERRRKRFLMRASFDERARDESLPVPRAAENDGTKGANTMVESRPASGALRTKGDADPAAAVMRPPPLLDDIVLTHAYFLSRTRRERKIMKPYAPLGPLYVAAHLRQNGYRAAFFDTTFEQDLSGFDAYIKRKKPPLVGIYVMETTRLNAVEMMRRCGECGVPVAVGGPDPSCDPGFYLRNGARFVVTGEGEETMAGIMASLNAGIPADRIAGIHPREGSRPREAKTCLDHLPFPARDLVDFRPYFKAWRRFHGTSSLQVSISRGCPFSCSRCSNPVFGRRYRMRSAKNLAEEMLFLKMIYRPDYLWFCDGMVGFDPGWIYELRDEVEKKKARLPFECLSQAGFVDEKTARELREAGCFRIWYEIESGSQKLLDRMKKNFTVGDIRRAASATRRAGIEVGFIVTLGYPSEAIGDLELTRALIREVKPDHCAVELAYPQRGTEFYAEVEEKLLPLRHAGRLENEDLITFQSRYSQNFYDIARNLIQKESFLCSSAPAHFTDRLGYGFYRLGYALMKNGANGENACAG